MKRCLICGCVVEDEVLACPQCKATKFEEVKEETEASSEEAEENTEE